MHGSPFRSGGSRTTLFTNVSSQRCEVCETAGVGKPHYVDIRKCPVENLAPRCVTISAWGTFSERELGLKEALMSSARHINTRMPVDEAAEAARCAEKAVPKGSRPNKEASTLPADGDDTTERPIRNCH